jgi:Asp-tRNA(Asn)/Glu-tRNA(Gln) amidotransferase B subunit
MQFRSVDEASRYVRKLSSILKHIGVCSGVMETGAMRCDVNVSIYRYFYFFDFLLLKLKRSE